MGSWDGSVNFFKEGYPVVVVDVGLSWQLRWICRSHVMIMVVVMSTMITLQERR